MPGVGKQVVDGAAADRRVDAVITLDCRQIDLQGVYLRSQCFKGARSVVNRVIVGGDDQVEAFLRAQSRQLVSDAARRRR